MDRWHERVADWKFGVSCLFLLAFMTIVTAAGYAIVFGMVLFLPGLLIEAFLDERQTAIFEAHYLNPLLIWGNVVLFAAWYPTSLARWIDEGVFRRREETKDEQKLPRRIQP